MIEKKRREGGEGREMVKSEENAPSPPGHACSSRPGHTKDGFLKIRKLDKWNLLLSLATQSV